MAEEGAYLELGLLGAPFVDPAAARRVVQAVSEDDFADPHYRTIYRAIARLVDRGVAVDVVTLTDDLQAACELDTAGGMQTIGSLVDAVSSADAVEEHARQLRRRSAVRRLGSLHRHHADEIEAIGGVDAEESIARARRELAEIEKGLGRASWEPAGEVMYRVLEQVEAGPLPSVLTGLHDLDEKIGGLHANELIVVAGRPSMGKTALAVGWAWHAAVQGTGVGLFSLEMGRNEVVGRIMGAEARVPYSKMRKGRLDEEDYKPISEACGLLRPAPLYIDDSGGLSSGELAGRARTMAQRHDIGLIVVDYLQLMRGTSGDNRTQEIAGITADLKSLSKELGVPVVLLSQLSRQCELRADHRPVLADLRDSGAIEQDADVVIFVYREAQYLRATSDRFAEVQGVAELIVGKQRNGPTGSIDVAFNQSLITFGDLSHRGYDA